MMNKQEIEKAIRRLSNDIGLLENYIKSRPINKDCIMERELINDMGNAIRVMSIMSKQLNNGWIPCIERRPNREEYLKDDGRFIVTDGNRRYQSHYDKYLKTFVTDKLIGGLTEDKCVIAWQPLPEPYREGDLETVQIARLYDSEGNIIEERIDKLN